MDMNNYTLDKFLSDLQQSIANRTLHETLSLDLSSAHTIPLLQPNLQSYTDSQLNKKIEDAKLFNNDWASFETLIQRYLIFIRDVDPWSLLNSIDLMISFYESLSIALNNKSQSDNLLILVQDSTRMIIPLTKLIDIQNMKINNRTNDYPRLSYVSTILLKSLNNLRGDPDLNTNKNRFKISVLFYISLTLCQTYFNIDSPILCNNVFSNMNVLGLNKKFIKASQLLRYRFILAKFHASQSSYYLAYNHLDWCLRHIPRNADISIHINILKYLIPCGLLVGRVPNVLWLQSILGSDPIGLQLLKIYLPLIEPYKKGDLSSVNRCIIQNEKYWQRKGLWIGFVQRIRILVLRNLINRVWKLSGSNLRFQDVVVSLQVSLRDNGLLNPVYRVMDGNQVDELCAESVLMALISNNLIRAKITATRGITMSKTGAFPDVYEMYNKKFVKSPNEDWLD